MEAVGIVSGGCFYGPPFFLSMSKRKFKNGFSIRSALKRVKIILSVKDSVAGNVACTIFLIALSATTLWLTHYFEQDAFGMAIAVVFCILWLGVAFFFFVPNIRKRRRSILGVEGDSLFWAISEWDGSSRKEIRKALPLASLKALKVVVTESSGADLDLGLEEVFVTDAAGKDHELPRSLHPGFHAKSIFEAIREVAPDFKLEKKISGSKD